MCEFSSFFLVFIIGLFIVISAGGISLTIDDKKGISKKEIILRVTLSVSLIFLLPFLWIPYKFFVPVCESINDSLNVPEYFDVYHPYRGEHVRCRSR